MYSQERIRSDRETSRLVSSDEYRVIFDDASCECAPVGVRVFNVVKALVERFFIPSHSFSSVSDIVFSVLVH